MTTAGHVAHGYAITGHKAQGLTCDHTYTLGTQTLYREWGYVAMSRGRITNQLYDLPTTKTTTACTTTPTSTPNRPRA